MVIHKTNKKIQAKRDEELENYVGNLLIGVYQVEKLKSKIAERVGGVYSRPAGAKINTSAFDFEKMGKMYRVTTMVEELDPKLQEVKEEMKTESGHFVDSDETPVSEGEGYWIGH